jgi:hypothetical protein
LQVVLNKKEKERLVIKLRQEGKTIREIAQSVHLSFTDIRKIIRKANGLKEESTDIKHKSLDTQALYLFSIGKTPLEVAIELDLTTSEVHDLQEEFWALNQMYELAFAYSEIKNFLPSFLRLFRMLKERKMLNKEYLSNLLKYAGHDIPDLTHRLQQLANEVIDLESKKKQSLDAVTHFDDTIDWHHRNIRLNRQILSELDKKINQKRDALNEKLIQQ